MQTQTPEITANTFDILAEANRRIASQMEMLVGVFRQHAQRLKLQGEAVPAAEVGVLLEGFGSKVEAMSRLHQRLVARNADRPTIQLGDYLNELSTHLTDALPISGRVGLDVELDAGCAVRANQILPIGLIVCELVTNATKHSHPAGVEGHVTIRCRRLGAELAIEVEDDGVGFPETMDPHTDAGPGIRTIRELAAAIGGSMRYHNSGLGLIAELRVPAVDHGETATAV